MTDPLHRSFASQLETVGHAIIRDWNPIAPDAGFAIWADRLATGCMDMSGLPPAELDTLPDIRWHEAPLLATTGYYLDLGINMAADHREDWLRGAQRLTQREALPADRGTFFFRPVDLLGIALGARALAAHDPAVCEWLSDLVERFRERLPTTMWGSLLGAITADVLGLPLVDLAPRGPSIDDLALAVWIWMGQPDIAARLPGCADQGEVARALLATAATSDPAPQGVARAAVTWMALRHAVTTTLTAATADDSTTSAEAQVLALCRRFPLLVRELRHRHASRPTIEITDEYDVQDLLRGVLRLHFDDVRPEEPMPSLGGAGTRCDFLLKKHRLVLETKMTRIGLRQAKLTAEIAHDKQQYSAHHDCRTLVCFVYDPGGFVDNPEALERELGGDDGRLRTVILVSPSGH